MGTSHKTNSKPKAYLVDLCEATAVNVAHVVALFYNCMLGRLGLAFPVAHMAA